MRNPVLLGSRFHKRKNTSTKESADYSFAITCSLGFECRDVFGRQPAIGLLQTAGLLCNPAVLMLSQPGPASPTGGHNETPLMSDCECNIAAQNNECLKRAPKSKAAMI